MRIHFEGNVIPIPQRDDVEITDVFLKSGRRPLFLFRAKGELGESLNGLAKNVEALTDGLEPGETAEVQLADGSFTTVGVVEIGDPGAEGSAPGETR